METLSEAAVALMYDYRGDILTDDSNREACRELARAGFLVVGHSFVGGREHFYRMTELGVRLADVLDRINVPSPEVSVSPHR